MTDPIEIENLTRRFGKKEAIAELTLSVPTGSIFRIERFVLDPR